jgi:hypothetical protein
MNETKLLQALDFAIFAVDITASPGQCAHWPHSAQSP